MRWFCSLLLFQILQLKTSNGLFIFFRLGFLFMPSLSLSLKTGERREVVKERGERHQCQRRSFHHPSDTWKFACQDLQENLHGGVEGNQHLDGGHGEGRKITWTRVGLQSPGQKCKRALQKRKMLHLHYWATWDV